MGIGFHFHAIVSYGTGRIWILPSQVEMINFSLSSHIISRIDGGRSGSQVSICRSCSNVPDKLIVPGFVLISIGVSLKVIRDCAGNTISIRSGGDFA